MKFDELMDRYIKKRAFFDTTNPVSHVVELRNWWQDLVTVLEQDETISAERKADLLPVLKAQLQRCEAALAGHERLVTKVMNETFQGLSG